jgi:replication-associated recombination protein RarA
MVGNRPVISRIQAQMLTGEVLQRALIYGPSGAGKTTLAYILGRYALCRDRRTGRGEPCGSCASCRLDFATDPPYAFHEWTGADLEEHWEWFEKNGNTLLGWPDFVFFLDEAQDLGQLHQKALLRRIERAEAVVLFATTHRATINDALENRFGASVYELQWPDREEVATHLLDLGGERKVVATRAQVLRVADHYSCDLRKCVDLVCTAKDQCSGGRVTNDFLDAVLGPPKGQAGQEKSGKRARNKL